MTPLTPADFEVYFRELHRDAQGQEKPPYDWQSRLAQRVVKGAWPGAIDLPTGSGKTACLDIAVFALACQVERPNPDRQAARRIFFCVNRRVIVDEAHQRAVRIARKIWEAEKDATNLPVLARVAAALRQLSGMARKSGPPLDVLELRGGIYRDNRWTRSATQPTIICTTVDQLGSRLLFRGYGVSANAAPIQAAMIAYDSLILLDEAHISRPFLQTLDFVKRYLNPEKWAEQSIGVSPVVVVPMTATPPEGVGFTDMIRLEEKDRENTALDNRLKARKPAQLLSVSDVTQSVIGEVEKLANSFPTTVGIIVNRVATAKSIYEELRSKHQEAVVELVIGSMRPIDRDRQAERLRPLVGPDRPRITKTTSFIVATQCLEVGADYDFDALVTECASLDALRQRFGRLNRGGREIEAKAVILIDNKNVKDELQLDDKKPLDPIYGNSLTRTWHWLNNHAARVITEQDSIAAGNRRRRNAAPAPIEVRRIDFGIDAFNAVIREHGDDGRIPTNLLAPSASLDAPVMLPAYVDVWCQTAPRPTPDPEVSLFIHGPQSGEPDVQVCWRADLIEDGYLKKEDWCDVVALLPPTTAECMSVPISRLRRWLTSETSASDQSDLLGVDEQPTPTGESKKEGKPNKKSLLQNRVGVLWRGTRKSDLIHSPDDLRPGDTIVLPVSASGWDELGHMPQEALPQIDVAESAFRAARDRVVLRLHPAMRSHFPDASVVSDIFEQIADTDDPPTIAELRRLLRVASDETEREANGLAETFHYLANPTLGLLCEQYPDARGIVLTTRCRVGSATTWFLPPVDDGDDDQSRTSREFPVGLADHTKHVCQEVTRILSVLPCTSLTEDFRLAADLHDLGKADERFQAMLRRTDRTDAWLVTGLLSALLAKSDGLAQTRSERDAARIRAGLPAGFRHEMLSVQLSERHSHLPVSLDNRNLVLHIIASHHGHARPFAPVVIDDDPPDVSVSGSQMSTRERQQLPPHRFDSGIAERFWNLTRRYGWWGLAYLETILRLADQQASADEDAGLFESDANSQLAEVTK